MDSSGHGLPLERPLKQCWKNCLPQIREECLDIAGHGVPQLLEEVLPGTSCSNLSNWVRIYFQHGHAYASPHRTAAQSNLAKACICMFITPCNHTQAHSVPLGKSRKVAPGLCSLGWKLPAVLLRKATQTLIKIINKNLQEHECALQTNLQHWDTGHGAAHTFCKQRRPSTNPLVRRPKPSAFTHKVMNHEHELLDAPIVCYRNSAFQTEREKSEDCRVYSKPIKITTLKCFSGTIYVNSKNPSLDLF